MNTVQASMSPVPFGVELLQLVALCSVFGPLVNKSPVPFGVELLQLPAILTRCG